MLKRMENFKPEFREYIDDLYQHHYTPEEIAGYVYGVMYSKFYNDKYKDQLNKDFARIPFVKSKELFEKMSELGWGLISVHLGGMIPYCRIGEFSGAGENYVSKVSYNEATQNLFINKTQYFRKVSPNIYHFEVGSYKIIAKYLKFRKGRKLTTEEINHVEKVINILAFTIRQMDLIDAVYRDIDALL
jgi:hypothetical protein